MKIIWVRQKIILCLSLVLLVLIYLLVIKWRNATPENGIPGEFQESTTEMIPTRLVVVTQVATSKSNISKNTLSSAYSQINTNSSHRECGQPRLVLVIQVHDRLEYLKQLFNSLEQNELIQSTLIITSHDLYTYEIHRFVTSINFTRVIPIYYPYSQQIYTDTFPGRDPNDCPKSILRQEALRIKCNNADTPDQYGNYREAHYTTIKHHWFWKIVTVFDKLQCLSSYTGYVMFLEEDHYTTPDFIATALELVELRNEQCLDCDFINMGVYVPKSMERVHVKNAEVFPWVAGDHNMGFGMDRGTWDRIKQCGGYFCNFDDYNWDWSLQATGMFCLTQNLKVLSLTVPRIFHLGKCGVHQRGKDCNPKDQVETVRNSFESTGQLAKNALEFIKPTIPLAIPRMPNPKGFGGWGDKRDIKLCNGYIRDEFPISKKRLIK